MIFMISLKKALHLMFMLLLMPPIGRNLNYQIQLNLVRKQCIDQELAQLSHLYYLCLYHLFNIKHYPLSLTQIPRVD